MNFEHVKLEKYNNVLAFITLSYPSTECYLTKKIMVEFCTAITSILNFRVIIIKSEGDSFCGGFDLATHVNENTHLENIKEYERMLREIYLSKAVTIALAHGSIIGSGAGFLAACDFIISTKDTFLGFPEVRYGIIPSHAIVTLSYKVNSSNLKELLIRGEVISSNKAKEIGVFNYVVDEKSQMSVALRLAEDIILGSPRSVIQTKQIINKLTTPRYSQDIRLAMDYAEDIMIGEEFLEGLESNLQNKTPSWYLDIADIFVRKSEQDMK